MSTYNNISLTPEASDRVKDSEGNEFVVKPIKAFNKNEIILQNTATREMCSARPDSLSLVERINKMPVAKRVIQAAAIGTYVFGCMKLGEYIGNNLAKHLDK